jgi:hypothetical protein
MKKLMFLLVMSITISTFSFGQLGHIPAQLTESFKSKYPNATDVSWSKRLTRYTIKFKMADKEYVSNFNDDGTWKDTYTVIEFNALPAAVKNGFTKGEFSDWEVQEIRKIDANGRDRTYRIEVKKNTLNQKNLFYNEKGDLIHDGLTL